MKTSLFNLQLEYTALLDLLEDVEFNEETGEVINNDEQLQELYNGFKDDLSTKLNSVMYVIKQAEGDAKTLDDEIKRLEKKKTTLNKRAKLLKDMIFKTVSCLEDKKFKTDKFSFTVRKSQPKVVIDSEDDLPRAYRVAKWSPDKVKIKADMLILKALNEREELDKESLELKETLEKSLGGCSLVSGESLSVR